MKNPLGFLDLPNRLVLQNFKTPHGSEGFKVYEVLKGPPKPLQAEGLGQHKLTIRRIDYGEARLQQNPSL